MTIFAVFPQQPSASEKLTHAIGATYPEDSYSLGDGVWLVSDSVTAKTVSDKLGVTDGTNGSAVVVEVASYFGRANPAVWSWIKAKWEIPSRG